MAQDANDLLMQGSLDSVKLSSVGDRFDGVCTDIGEPYQSLSMDGKKIPQWWDDEKTKPKMVAPFVFRSDTDNKEYVLHIGQSSQRQACVAKAVRDAGADGIRIGGHISVAVVDMERTDYGPNSYKTIHAAVWTPPAAAASNMVMDGVPADPLAPRNQAASAPSAADQLAVAQQQAASAPTAVAPAQSQPAAGNGLDLTGLDPKVAEAIRQLQQQAATNKQDGPPF
jgi:hypothetical protein